MTIKKVIERLGEQWCYNHLRDFGLESADRVVDFYNNGGLEFHNEGQNYALQYAAVRHGRVEIGAWAWHDDDDFDLDATFEVYEEDEFSGA